MVLKGYDERTYIIYKYIEKNIQISKIALLKYESRSKLNYLFILLYHFVTKIYFHIIINDNKFIYIYLIYYI